MASAAGLTKEALKDNLELVTQHQRTLIEENAGGDEGGYYPIERYERQGYSATHCENIRNMCPHRVDPVLGDTYKLDVHKTKHWDQELNAQSSKYTVQPSDTRARKRTRAEETQDEDDRETHPEAPRLEAELREKAKQLAQSQRDAELKKHQATLRKAAPSIISQLSPLLSKLGHCLNHDLADVDKRNLLPAYLIDEADAALKSMQNMENIGLR